MPQGLLYALCHILSYLHGVGGEFTLGGSTTSSTPPTVK
jgi:hypothetical protein